ncbi:MAG TPA: alpha/beta hydrolase [Terracidiphilus sp.]|nr:alpha/beta hydrolase [Terracidiphilus sp.]
MDGTGKLFADFVKLLPGWIEPLVLSYPPDRKLSYDQLLPIVESAVRCDEPFVILAESFSTPLAVWLAARVPDRLQALVLCAGFVLPPRRKALSLLVRTFAPAFFAFGLPESICRQFLVGNSAPQSRVDTVRNTVSSVSSGVLAHRLRSVLSCQAKHELRSVSVPLLCIAGIEDRLVTESSFNEVRQVKPDAQVARIKAPHLLLQSNPREVVDALVSFLKGINAEQEIAGN